MQTHKNKQHINTHKQPQSQRQTFTKTKIYMKKTHKDIKTKISFDYSIKTYINRSQKNKYFKKYNVNKTNQEYSFTNRKTHKTKHNTIKKLHTIKQEITKS